MSKDESKKEGKVSFFQRHFAWHLHHRPANRAGQKYPIEALWHLRDATKFHQDLKKKKKKVLENWNSLFFGDQNFQLNNIGI